MNELAALRLETDKLWEDNRLLRQKLGTTWDLAMGQISKTAVISMFLGLPGLRGFWSMASFDSSGNAYDLSEQGRTLTYNGNPTYNFAGLAPYISLDGTGDYLSRTDAAFNIVGTESYVASAIRGLTILGYFYFSNAAGSQEGMIAKWQSGGQWAYLLDRLSNGSIRFVISGTGSDNDKNIVSTTPYPDQATWCFYAGRFVPSTSIDLFINATKFSTTASVPANIFASTAPFAVGAHSAGTLFLTGRASMVAVCACALSDEIIGALYQRSRALFRV